MVVLPGTVGVPSSPWLCLCTLGISGPVPNGPQQDPRGSSGLQSWDTPKEAEYGAVKGEEWSSLCVNLSPFHCSELCFLFILRSGPGHGAL